MSKMDVQGDEKNTPPKELTIINHATKKRKRQKTTTTGDKKEKLKQYGVDLPDIPGIPIQIIPLHIHAVKSTTKYFQYVSTKTVVTNYNITDDEEKEENEKRKIGTVMGTNVGTNVSSVVDSVLHRMEQVEKDQQNTNEASTKQLRDLFQRKTEAMKSWLEAIYRWIRDHSRQQVNMEQQQQQVVNKGETVPIAILEHLLDVILDHQSYVVRRAATHTLGYLLHKSATCRHFLFNCCTDGEDTTPTNKDRLIHWLNTVIAGSNNSPAINESTSQMIFCWQQESYVLIQKLEASYGNFYPTLSVAIQLFLQGLGDLGLTDLTRDSTPSTTTTATTSRRSATDYRNIRDMAMKYFQQEEKQIDKLMNRAYKYMDILVPRIGTTNDPCSIEKTTPVCNDEGSEDDMVDWEDGWENNEDEDGPTVTDQINISHSDAVENTLATMESVGGLTHGMIEIDFAQTDDNHATMLSNNQPPDNSIVIARERLLRIVEKLSKQHLPRLSIWVEGLTKADGLVEVNRNGMITFLSMKGDQGNIRQIAYTTLSQCKNKVATILQAASRLRMGEISRTTTTTTNETTPNTLQTRPAERNVLVNAKVQRRSFEDILDRKRRTVLTPKDVTKRTSNRIQIKYYKN